jgi:hypothetical protein
MNIRKKKEILEINSPLSQLKNTVETHSIRLEQEEDKTQGSKIKCIQIKQKQTKKPEESLDKRFKNCKRNMQELCDPIKRPNLQIGH